jgi:hypothetical protein
MKYQPGSNSLCFGSRRELEEFHLELSSLIRSAMTEATRRIADPEQAKQHSRRVLKEYATLLRTLNTLRTSLPRRSF